MLKLHQAHGIAESIIADNIPWEAFAEQYHTTPKNLLIDLMNVFIKLYDTNIESLQCSNALILARNTTLEDTDLKQWKQELIEVLPEHTNVFASNCDFNIECINPIQHNQTLLIGAPNTDTDTREILKEQLSNLFPKNTILTFPFYVYTDIVPEPKPNETLIFSTTDPVDQAQMEMMSNVMEAQFPNNPIICSNFDLLVGDPSYKDLLETQKKLTEALKEWDSHLNHLKKLLPYFNEQEIKETLALLSSCKEGFCFSQSSTHLNHIILPAESLINHYD